MSDHCVGYCRVSSTEQGAHGLSLDVQREKYHAYCERMGYRDAGLFIDIASGGRADRREYQRMLTQLRAGGVSVVVIVYLDRFGRNVRESLSRIWELQDLDVRVEATDEYLGDGEDPLYMLLGSWKAEREAIRIGERSRAGKAAKLQRGGGWWPGMTPYGWRRVVALVDGRPQSHVEIDDAEAAVVRQMATLALGGLGYRRVAAAMNDQGSRTRAGVLWHQDAVRTILTRPHNTGRVRWGGTRSAARRAKGHYDAVDVAGAIPRILDDAAAARLAEQAAVRSTLGGRALGTTALLSGLLKCGNCGHAMFHVRTGPGHAYNYYRCGMHAVSAACTPKMQRAEKLNGAVLEALAPAADEALARSLVPAAEPVRDPAKEADGVRRELARVEQEERHNLRDRRAGVISSDAQLGRLNRELDGRHEALSARLAELEKEAAETVRRRTGLSDLPLRVQSFIDDCAALPIAAQKAGLQRIVERVTVWESGEFQITLRL